MFLEKKEEKKNINSNNTFLENNTKPLTTKKHP